MTSFRTNSAPSATANPRCVREMAYKWQKAVYETLDVMGKGEDPAHTDSVLARMPDGTPVKVLEVLHISTVCLCFNASHCYDWFKPLPFWEVWNCVELWCAGNRDAEDFLHARSLVRIAEAEFIRLDMTTRRDLAPMSPEEAMDSYFVAETAKPKHISGTHQQILDRAKRQHPEWPCPGCVNAMLKRVNKYRDKHSAGPRPRRKA